MSLSPTATMIRSSSPSRTTVPASRLKSGIESGTPTSRPRMSEKGPGWASGWSGGRWNWITEERPGSRREKRERNFISACLKEGGLMEERKKKILLIEDDKVFLHM